MSEIAASITPRGPPGLTDRQILILTLISVGLTTDAIAGRLHLAPTTVNKDVWRALFKLRAANRAHAVRIALTKGLICACASDGPDEAHYCKM